MKGQNFPEHSGTQVLPGKWIPHNGGEQGRGSRPWWISEVVAEELMINQLKPSAPTLFHCLRRTYSLAKHQVAVTTQVFPKMVPLQRCLVAICRLSCLLASYSLAGKEPGRVGASNSAKVTRPGKPIHITHGSSSPSEKGPEKPILITHGSSSPSSPDCKLWVSLLCRAL